jgi:hypothetical protein
MIAKFFPWASKRPSVIAIILALVLLGLGQFFKTHEVLGPLARFTNYLEHSLRSFDAMNVTTIFYRELTGCELVSDGIACAPGPDATERLENGLQGGHENGLIGTIIVAVINTVASVFGQSTWLGILLWLVFLGGAGVVMATMLDIEESGPVGIVLLIVLTPALAGVAALALKWLLLVLVLLFSEVLAGIVFVLGAFGSFIAWGIKGNAVLSTAHSIDSLVAVAPPAKPPTDQTKA